MDSLVTSIKPTHEQDVFRWKLHAFGLLGSESMYADMVNENHRGVMLTNDN